MSKAHTSLSKPWDGYWRTRPKVWTTDRLWKLAEYLERGMSDQEIAWQMETTVNAVRLARKRHGLSSRTALLLSARRVAALLGVGCAKTITRWIEAGHLRGKRGQLRGPYWQWFVRHEDLLVFLEDPGTHHMWRPERITDSALREWAGEINTERFLTPGEVAERCYVTFRAVNQWIRSGVLPAVKYGNWWIRESELEGFVPPNQRSKVGMIRTEWCADEDAAILGLRAEGVTFVEIGRAIGRPMTSAANRYYRLIAQEHTAVGEGRDIARERDRKREAAA